MTKYKIAQKIRDLLDLDYEDLIDATLDLADFVEECEEDYIYKGERDNGEWVYGCVLKTNEYEHFIVTSYTKGDEENQLKVRAYEVNPDTIEAV